MSTKKRRNKRRKRSRYDRNAPIWRDGYHEGFVDGATTGGASWGVDADYYYERGRVVVPGMKAPLVRAAREMNAQIRAARRAYAIGKRDGKYEDDERP